MLSLCTTITLIHRHPSHWFSQHTFTKLVNLSPTAVPPFFGHFINISILLHFITEQCLWCSLLLFSSPFQYSTECNSIYFYHFTGIPAVGGKERWGDASSRHQTQPRPAVLPQLCPHLVWDNAPWRCSLQDKVLSPFPGTHPCPGPSLQFWRLCKVLQLSGRQQDEPKEEMFCVVRS